SKLTETQQREMVRRSFVAEVAGVLRIPEVTAGRLIDDSAVLMDRLPATLAALREGEISLRHARVIVDQVATLDDERTLALEQAAVPFAMKLTVSKFSQKARVLRERIDAESITERRVKSAKDRRVEFLPARDGMAWLNLYTTAPEATALYTAIRAAAMRLQTTTETCTLTQLGADVCADALAAGLAGDTSESPVSTTAFDRIQPTVFVTVPALTLLGESDEPGDLAGYGPIDPETARKLAGRSKTWYRLLTDPESGALLSLGRTRYTPTKQMRDYLVLRDGTCRWEGCNRQATHCEIDHTEAWEFGGPTDCDNLSHVCPKHHRMKHQTTWTAKQLPGGVIRWTSPDGRSYVTEPEVALPMPTSRRQDNQSGSAPPDPATAPPRIHPSPPTASPGTDPD
ncbi:HNH endonuclease signature motif containing protein, partial [Mycetocola miduiensis]